jgi:hypothetical protein
LSVAVSVLIPSDSDFVVCPDLPKFKVGTYYIGVLGTRGSITHFDIEIQTERVTTERPDDEATEDCVSPEEGERILQEDKNLPDEAKRAPIICMKDSVPYAFARVCFIPFFSSPFAIVLISPCTGHWSLE